MAAPGQDRNGTAPARSGGQGIRRRWIDLARQSAATLQAADLVTVVGDRESDIYELFAAPRPAHVHLLVRAAQDRSLAEGARLLAHADSLCGQHRYMLEAPEKPGQQKRTAKVAVGFGSVQIKRPARMTRGELPDAVAMSLVVVREADPARRRKARALGAADDARRRQASKPRSQIVGWYRKRWLIEQLFRTLKTQGFNVEESQVVQAHALMNLVTAALIAAMQTLQRRWPATAQPASP